MAAKKGKKKKFRPTKTPRYLPGLVSKHVLEADLKMFNDFRRKVFYATCKVDSSPPPMNPYAFINAARLRADRDKLFEIDRQNKLLLQKINLINRHGGRVDTFNPNAYARQSKWRAHLLKLREIEQKNKKIYRVIQDAKSEYSAADMRVFWKEMVLKLKYIAKLPLVILEKKSLDQILNSEPSISGGMEATSDRPLIFMDFEIRNLMPLGRIIVELYYDFVPVTVQNFLSLCKGEDGLTYKNSPVHNVVRYTCIELGDITKGNGKGGMSIYGERFPEENFVLKHTKGGVLSMIDVGNQENNSQFSITLNKVEKFDGKRVVFGKTIKGNETLVKIMDLGRTVGRPPYPIIISNCGEYVKNQKH